MSILLDAMGNVAVHHDFVELVASRSDVVHQTLVRGEFVFDRSVAVVNFLQFHAVSQLVDHLNPEPRLKQNNTPVGSVDKGCFRRMVSSRILRRVPLVRTDVSEELSASIIRVTRIGELGTTLALTSNKSHTT
jgi:hypothetical protein